MLSDNGTMAFYAASVPGSNSSGLIGGEFITADLAATDLTGEFVWTRPPSTQGLHRAGIDTVLTANGCLYPSGAPLTGLGDLTLSGGNLEDPETNVMNVFAGTPTFLTDSLLVWTTASPSAGTFRVQVRVPGVTRPVSGSGVYLPKNRTAWGFFPGMTEGGKVELSVPMPPP
jgi:hypothetical protein